MHHGQSKTPSSVFNYGRIQLPLSRKSYYPFEVRSGKLLIGTPSNKKSDKDVL